MDDIEFPDPPETIDRNDFDEIKDPTQLEDKSKFPLQLDITPQKVTEDDLNFYNLQNIEKKVLINEFSDCDLYLKNIHKGFRFASSVTSLINLVAAGINVHKHRRQVMKELKAESKGTTLEFDANGNIKP